MTVFSSVQAAARYGFLWMDYDPDTRLHIVVRDLVRKDGMKCRALAFARVLEPDACREAL